eukprot:scaffold22492_cov33-Tisochrysis_lutea.AAC.2
MPGGLSAHVIVGRCKGRIRGRGHPPSLRYVVEMMPFMHLPRNKQYDRHGEHRYGVVEEHQASSASGASTGARDSTHMRRARRLAPQGVWSLARTEQRRT